MALAPPRRLRSAASTWRCGTCARAAGLPLYRLLGGRADPIAAYAGGVSLGYQPPEALVGEVASLVEAGFGAVKLRVGDAPVPDVARVAAVRQYFADALTILVDANTGYTPDDVREVMPRFDELGVGWLEEPFAPYDDAAYRAAAAFGAPPLAAGENHFTRYDFARLADAGAVRIWQPDPAKTGGITEALNIATLAADHGIAIHPHTSVTAVAMAANVHFLAAIDNGGYFEADCSIYNPLRDALCDRAPVVGAAGTVRPFETPGIGVAVDADFLAAHPVIAGSCYA